MTAPVVVVAAAWVHVRDRRVLTVRAHGSDAFYLPGGKPEPGETDAEAAAREAAEEVGVHVDPAGLSHLVTIDAPAAEIVEIAWFTTADRPRCAPAIRILLNELANADLID